MRSQPAAVGQGCSEDRSLDLVQLAVRRLPGIGEPGLAVAPGASNEKPVQESFQERRIAFRHHHSGPLPGKHCGRTDVRLVNDAPLRLARGLHESTQALRGRNGWNLPAPSECAEFHPNLGTLPDPAAAA